MINPLVKCLHNGKIDEKCILNRQHSYKLKYYFVFIKLLIYEMQVLQSRSAFIAHLQLPFLDGVPHILEV